MGFERRGNFQRKSFAPVSVGDEIDVKIEAVGEKGDGIARKRGFVLFVPSTKEGDEIRIKVVKVLRKVGFAEAIGPALGPVEDESEQPEAVDDKPVAQPEPAPESPQDTEDFGEPAAPVEEPAPETAVCF